MSYSSEEKTRAIQILDIGCGDKKTDGAIGVDNVSLPGVDILHDLKTYPWPFPDNHADYIYMNSIIEHLPDTFRVMEEVHRILKPGGVVKITTSYWNHHDSISSPQHCSFFDEKTWRYFTTDAGGYYTKARFEMMSLEYQYDYRNKYFFLCLKPLMNLASVFLCNIKAGMIVEMRKPE